MKIPRSWDLEGDIVVIGYGGAGSAAAIEAHDHQAEVIMLEKTASGGGTTATSGGGISAPLKPLNIEKVVSYLIECGKGDIEEKVAKAWAQEAVNLPNWLESLGAKLEMATAIHPSLLGGYHRNYEGYEQFTRTGLPNGRELFKVLRNGVEDRAIKVYTETRANRLITNDDGEVLGVEALQNGKSINVKARKAVILTCGGFGHNEEMKRNFLRMYPSYFLGTFSCTGDGIRMGQVAGAALNKMNEVCGVLVHHFPAFKSSWSSALQTDAGRRGCIIVNRYGKRFTDEQVSYDTFNTALIHFDPLHDEWTNIPAYVVFDEKTRLIGPVASTVPLVGEYTWSPDNSAEIDKGWIKKAETIEELAVKSGIGFSLVDTVNRFNEFCKNGTDLDFGRKFGLIPLEKPPFYSIEGYPGMFDTFGGLKINEKAQVIDTVGQVIPRLYAAGTTANGVAGFYYPIGGTAIADGFAFGKIAARNATQESTQK